MESNELIQSALSIITKLDNKHNNTIHYLYYNYP